MMIKPVVRAVCAFSAAAVLVASAYATDIEMLAKLKTLYPSTRISSVAPSAIAGLWEVRMGQQVAYADESGKYFLFGAMMDMSTQKDLTNERRVGQGQAMPDAPAPAQKVAFPQSFLSNAIKTVKGDGSRVLAVFSDPQCPYCKQFEHELAKLDNVTIYTFLYPILAEESKVKSVSVWCSGDRSKSWKDLMTKNMQPKLTSCNNPVNDNLVLGSRMGIQATPAMVAFDGRVAVGAMPSTSIELWLGPKVGLAK